MLEVGATTARVGYDGVELFWGELIDIPASKPLCQSPFAIVSMEGATAVLVSRSIDIAPILSENFDCVSIDIAVDKILRAT